MPLHGFDTSPRMRYLWIPLSLYGVPNVLALVGAYWFDVLLVDMVPVALTANDPTLIAVFLAILFSFFFLIACVLLAYGFFRTGHRISAPPIIGQIVFILQLTTIVALVFSDYGRAGIRSGSVDTLSIIASYVKSDLFFILYYGHQRPNRFPAINFILYIVSNIIRGWSGMWLIILLIEAYYVLERRAHGLPLRRLLALGFVGIALFPVANFVKQSVRGTEIESLSFFESYVVLIDRLQHLTNVTLIAQEADDIISNYKAGKINPWYINGALGARIAMVSPSVDGLSEFITKNYLVDPGTSDQSFDDPFWYTNVGISGWFFVIPWYQIPVYLIYLAGLIIAPYWLVGRFLTARSMIPVLHVASFVYVLHGWLEVQLTFLICVTIYVAVARLLRGAPSAKRMTVHPA